MRLLAIVLPVILCGCMGHSVRAPKSDVPFVHSIPWWTYQDGLSVTRLEANILDSKLNMMNFKSLVEVVIEGDIHGTKGWRPHVERAHIFERVVRGVSVMDASTEWAAEIGITPLIETEKDDSYKAEVIHFRIKQEMLLNSMGWGRNTFSFVSGALQKSLTVVQRK